MHPSHSSQSPRAPQPQRAAAAPSCRVGDLLQATDPLRNGPDCLDPRDVERFLGGQLNG
ncbi:MAG: hypothetical protein HYU66_18660, partial [Armatimonadetes bacterium]|nr:hypothetical protein [Armatimonadota bacterium]